MRAAAGGVLSAAACGEAPPPEPPRTPQASGTIVVPGLSAPVRVVRDRWGVPHIFAESRDDLFAAQGFVQAQDRLFQMDLWRRSAQGRLAEVFGANFIERDAATRRLQYHGDVDAEWASYGEDTKPIVESFVRGVNAWVAIARERPPELFRLAGWLPERWTPSDLLNRTDAFDRHATIEAVSRSGLPAIVVDAVRGAAAPPFFTGLAARVSDRVPAGTRFEAVRADAEPLESPSSRKWNAIGAAVPWRPGIAIGHDGIRTWEAAGAQSRADVHVEPLDEAARIVKDTIVVKGRAEPFAFDTLITPRGVVIATDRTAAKQFTLDWDGFRAGTAPAFKAEALAATATGGQAMPRRGVGKSASIVFQHSLAITDSARKRFNIGPFDRPADGRPFRVAWDPRSWDASRAINAPGQSEWADSPHYADLAALWASGETFPLAYSDAAVNANAEATLTLSPDRRR
jgi:hypothetical protein